MLMRLAHGHIFLLILLAIVVAGRDIAVYPGDERSGITLSDPDLLLPSLGGVKYRLRGYNGCFHWTSLHAGVVQLEPVGTDPCSDSTWVKPSTSTPGRRHGTILAEEQNTGHTIRCEVVIDDLERLAILTTRRTLSVGDYEILEVQAFDPEGNVFTAVEGLPFAWAVNPPGIIQSVAFRDAPVKASPVTRLMEEKGSATKAIVVKGVQPGRVEVVVELQEKGYSNVAKQVVSLAVIEPLALHPSIPIVVAPGSIVRYTLVRLRDGRESAVHMPNARFQWLSTNVSVSTVDSIGTALTQAIGFTTIRVHDTEMAESDAYAELRVSLPSMVIITALEIDGWTWSTSQQYEVEVAAADASGRRMALVDAVSLVLDAVGECVKLERLADQVKPGRPVLSHRYRATTHCVGTASFVGKLSHTASTPLWEPVQAVQEVVIHAGVALRPPAVLLPWHPTVTHSFALVASGGSGLYDWRSDSVEISVGDGGVVTGRSVGRAMVQAADRRNPRNRASVPVTVAEVAAIRIVGAYQVRVGDTLVLQVEALDGAENVFSNASAFPYQWSVESDGALTFSSASNARGLFTAHREGSADVKVWYGRVSATARIKVYLPLRATFGEQSTWALVTLGGAAMVNYVGGPPPSSTAPSAIAIVNRAHVRVENAGARAFLATCLVLGNHTIIVRAGTPGEGVVEEVNVTLACQTPVSAVLSAFSEQGMPLPLCDAVGGQRAFFVNGGSVASVLVELRNMAGRRFFNSSSVKVQWEHSQAQTTNLLSFDNTSDLKNPLTLLVTAHASLRGSTAVTAAITGYDTAMLKRLSITDVPSLQLRTDATVVVVSPVTILPPPNPILCVPDNRVLVSAGGGSGRYTFTLNDTNVGVLSAVESDHVTLSPREPGVARLIARDVCTTSRAEVNVRTAVPSSIRVKAPAIELQGARVGVGLVVEDMYGMAFDPNQLKTANISASVDACDGMSLHREDVTRYAAVSHRTCVAFLSFVVSTDLGKVRSPAHQLSIVAPLSISPPLLRLVPCASSQLAVEGVSAGMTVVYSVDDESIASVDDQGTVTAHAVGLTTVRAVAETIDAVSGTRVRLSTASCEIRVSTLTSIRIVSPSKRLLAGNSVSLRIEGATGEPPSAFDSISEISYSWRSSSPDALSLLPVFDTAPTPSFSSRVVARQGGRGTILATVSFPACGAIPAAVLEDRTVVQVLPALELRHPHRGCRSGGLLLSPLGRDRIITNKDGNRLRYTVLGNDTSGITVDTDGTVRAGSIPGSALVSVEDEDGDVVVVRVSVSRVHAIALLPQHPSPILPVGEAMLMTVQLYDALGTPFTSLDGVDLTWSRSFLDVVEMTSGPTNGTMLVRALRHGRCVLRVQVTGLPNVVDFVSVVVGNVITPSNAVAHVGGELVFRVSHGLPGMWSSSDPSVLRVDAETGHAWAVSAGQSAVYHNGTVRTHTLVTVARVAHVEISQPRDAVVRSGGSAIRVPVSFVGTHGGRFEANSGPDLSHHVLFECITDQRFATASAVTEGDKQFCVIAAVRPEITALQTTGNLDSLVLRVNARDSNNTYSVEQTSQIPMLVPLAADPDSLHLSTSQPCGRVSVYGQGVSATAEDSRVTVRQVRAGTVQVLDVCASRVSSSFSTAVILHSDERLRIPIVFTVEPSDAPTAQTTQATPLPVVTASPVNMTVVLVSVIFAVALVLGAVLVQRSKVAPQHEQPQSPSMSPTSPNSSVSTPTQHPTSTMSARTSTPFGSPPFTSPSFNPTGHRTAFRRPQRHLT